MQLGAGTNAFKNKTPSFAILSKFGVFNTSHIFLLPSYFEYIFPYLPQSSANANRMFGFIFYFSVVPIDPNPSENEELSIK